MGNSQSHNQQRTYSVLERSSSSETLKEFEIIRPIVVTGFGKIYPDDPSDEANLSWRVVEKLSETIDYQGIKIPVIKGQPSKEDKNFPEPVKVCYSYVEDPSFQKWLVSTDALVYVHLGVNDKSGLVQLETTGRRKDIHFVADKYPDDDTPSYLSESDEKEPQRTSFQVSTELCNDLEAFKSKITFPVSCSDKPLNLTYQRSDNAGTFLCDFLYYTSLNLAPKKNVLFVHIPGELPDDLPDDINCYNQCKVDALAEMVEFLVKKLLAQIDAAEKHTAATSTVEQ
jgi:hypothetical protein